MILYKEVNKLDQSIISSEIALVNFCIITLIFIGNMNIMPTARTKPVM